MKKALQYLLKMSAVSNSYIPMEKDFKDVVPGDHLVYNTEIGYKINFYVLATPGNGRIKVAGMFLEDDDDPFVEERLIFDADKAKQLKIMERTLCESECKNVLKLLYKGVGDISKEKQRIEKLKHENKSYNFFCNNSEHLLTYIKKLKSFLRSICL